MSDLSRVEQLLRNALGDDIYEVTPQSRVEVLLQQLNELIEDIGGGSVDPEVITAWLAENIHDGAVIDSSLTVEGAAADSKKTGTEISQLKEDLSDMNTATSADVGKALKAKTVTNGKVTEWEFGEAGGNIESYQKYIEENADLINSATWVEGYSISATGAITVGATYHCTDLIPVEIAQYLLVYIGTGANNNTRIHGYDQNGDWVKQITVSASGTVASPISVDVNINNGISFVRISAHKEIKFLVFAKKNIVPTSVENISLEMEYVLNTKTDIKHIFELPDSSIYINSYMLSTYQAVGKTIEQVSKSASSNLIYYKIDVSGYKKVFFPCFKSSALGGELFEDENGVINSVYTNAVLDSGVIIGYDLQPSTKYMYLGLNKTWNTSKVALIGVISSIESGGGSGQIIVHDDSYPSLTAEEKQQIVDLCNDYFDKRTQFSYGGTRFRNQYVNTDCISNNKFLINCGVFAQFIWMGREASDFDLSAYTNQIHKAFNWGYYFDFAIHKAIYGLAKASSGTDAQKYYGYQTPTDVDPYAFNAYTENGAMVWRSFMAAADLAEELYNMGCEVPRRAAEVGDLVFYRGPEYSGMTLETQLNFRNISHVGVITDIDYLGSGRMRTTEVTFRSDLGTVAHLSLNESDNSDKTRAGFYENRIVMIARHPHAFGIPTNVPDFITAI